MFINYLSPQQINNIKKYKYNSLDTSPISNYITRPFWNWLAMNCYPLWLSPNVLTLLSIGVLFVAYFTINIYDGHFCSSIFTSPSFQPIPGWVFVLTSICSFLAHTLDGSDGMQARKLKISSPLGELLDHGCDSMAAFLLVMFVISSFYVCGPGGLSLERLLANLASVLFLFYLSHWEKYITGCLYLPWAYDPTYILVTVFMAVLPLFQPINIFIPVCNNISLADMVEVIYQLAIWGISVPVSLYNIYCFYSTNEGRPFKDAIRPMWAVLLFNILFALFVVYFDPRVVASHPKYVFWMYGVVSSNIVCRLIVAQMLDSPAPIFTPLFVPLIGLVCCGFLHLPYSLTDMVFVNVVCFMTAFHFHYFASVIYQLSCVLKVPLFTVPRKD